MVTHSGVMLESYWAVVLKSKRLHQSIKARMHASTRCAALPASTLELTVHSISFYYICDSNDDCCRIHCADTTSEDIIQPQNTTLSCPNGSCSRRQAVT